MLEFSSTSIGPATASMTGSRTSPWNRPNTTVRTKTLKNDRNICDVENPNKTKARNVESPPLKMAEPMDVRANTDFSCLDPEGKCEV